ncbi:Speckle-type POZ protein [Araneus ventricosus]|uniref:Speckle-type POZ protein n=1 Tax=Araneus ventricosus TaxID=182803 RepID=A0A4Y2SVI8_ARAVE|nr:Speckle-type POZ protein [Araneus ventricosus]
MLFNKTLNNSYSPVPLYQFHCKVSITGEDFQKLKQLPNDTFVLTCRIKRTGVDTTMFTNIPSNTSVEKNVNGKSLQAVNNSSVNKNVNGKSLQTDLMNYSDSLSKEKVNLCVGEETESVTKAVLCERSPVFAMMFRNDMRESKENTVFITDIKMPVLRALVSFLSSGVLPDCDFDFLCDLYYAADKYEVVELHQACIRLLLGKISLENIIRVLKLFSLHNDELLKSTVMALISVNIETIKMTSDWKNLLRDDPEIALKASTFFNF